MTQHRARCTNQARTKRLSAALCLIAASVAAAPRQLEAATIRLLPGIETITFWERTGGSGPEPRVFGVNSQEMTTRRADPLSSRNRDFATLAAEYYDVFYSNSDGTFNLDGEYITVEAVFDGTLPQTGGLNIAEVQLNFENGTDVFADVLAGFVALGDNAAPQTASRAVDGELATHTTPGNTNGQSQRLRVAVGFVGEEPTEVSLDIHPGSCPNPINFSNEGKTPVAILGDSGFDVLDIDIASIRLAGIAPIRSSFENVGTPFSPYLGREEQDDCTDEGPDGFLDLTFRVSTRELLAAIESDMGEPLADGDIVVVPLSATTAAGEEIIGEDVVVVKRKKKGSF